MRHSFICSQKYFPTGLQRYALLFAQAWPPASPHCSRKCAASPVPRDLRTGKYATCSFSECESWSTRRRLRGLRFRSGQQTLFLIAGFSPASIEETMKRSGVGSSELSTSQTYKAAARLLPAPTNFFAYVDTGMLYSRLDASLRPMLLMAAAFVPAVASSVDATKLPSPEVITRHLSPIVSSQRYDLDGYVAESIGPITLDQSAIGLAILSSFGAGARQKAGAAVTGWGGSSP